MEIQTQRLTLFPYTPKIHDLFSERYEMGPHIERHIEELKRNSELEGWGVWLAIRKDSGKPIGDLGFKGQPYADGIVEIGYGILPEEQNRGFATEAAASLIGWAFNTGQVRKVIAECAASNTASVKVLRKLGMKEAGENQEMIYWSLLK